MVRAFNRAGDGLTAAQNPRGLEPIANDPDRVGARDPGRLLGPETRRRDRLPLPCNAFGPDRMPCASPPNNASPVSIAVQESAVACP